MKVFEEIVKKFGGSFENTERNGVYFVMYNTEKDCLFPNDLRAINRKIYRNKGILNYISSNKGKIVINYVIMKGKDFFKTVTSRAKHQYEVEQSISGYYRLLCNGEIMHDDSACEETNEENSAYLFFAELIKENENL